VSLPDEGPAPAFAGITAWRNTAGDRPLRLAALRSKVVLVDFWTYSCINCRRSLPHLEAWYRAYRRDGLVVVGVHTPEFAFEHVVGNVTAAARSLGVTYPIAVDDGYATWDAYAQEYWPAEYLIDQHGDVRHTHFGEGDYAGMERDLRALLVADGARHLPAPTEVADTTPTAAEDLTMTPERYVGYERLAATPTHVVPDAETRYALPSSLAANELAFGGRWDVHATEATAGRAAVLALHYTARDVYLVLSGHGTLRVTEGATTLRTVAVAGVPNLYTLVASHHVTTGVLVLHASNGLHAWDFTFG